MASNPRKRLGYRMRTLLSAAFTPTVQTDPDTTSVNEESVPKISVDRDSVPRCDSKFDIRRTSAWFLRDNVRIADDVKSKPASLSFTARQKDSKNSKQPEQQDLSRQKAREVTEISLEFYEKLRNMVASTLILNSRGEFSELGLGILLLSSVNDSERVIDEVVQHLAKDLGANLICFDKDDTEELACDFARDARDEQVHSLEVFEILTRYFAVRCKRHETDDTLQRSNSSFGAILGAADTKALEGKEHDENEPAPLNKSPVLIHHKNARIMMEQFHGYKFFASMREHVRRRRAQGAAVTVITTLSTSGYSGKDDWDEVPKLRRKLGVPTYMSVEFKPTHIFNRASPLDEPCSATSSNIRRLRYWLRLLNPDLFPPGFLDLDTEWAHSLGGVERIESQRWTDHQLRHMMVQVAGMAWQKPQLTLEDVKIVLERALFEDQYSGIHADDESNHTNSASRWANFPPRVQEIIHKLEQLAFQGEQKGFPDYLGFLEYLVDPGKTEIGWSEIVLEPGYSDAIKQLVPQIGDASQDRGPPYGILKQGTIGGALLYGPPGTGKTQLARVIAAQRTDLVVICVSPADIEAFLVGETEKSIKALFHLGKMLAPSLIFIDEADSLLLARSPVNAPWNRSQVNQFLGEMDGLTKSTKAPFILLSTNLPGDLDAAVLRRLSGILYIGLPSSESRAEIFKVMLRDEVLDSDVDLADLAWKTSGFSGSDIRTLCVQAALMCETFVEDEAKNKSKRLLSRMLFERALSRVNRTVTLSVMEPIAKFAEEYDPAAYRQIKMSMSVKYTRNFELKNTWTQGMSVESSDPTSAVDESNFSSLIRKSFPKQLADELAGPEKPHTKAGPEVAEASASQETIGRGHATSLYQAETAELAEQFDSKSILGRLPPLASPKPKKLQSHHDAPGHMVGSSTVDSKLDEIATPSTNSTEHPEALRPTTEVVAAEMEDLYAAIPLHDGNKIRVLTIAPVDSRAQTETPQPISCALEVVDLQDWTPEYAKFRRSREGTGLNTRFVEPRVRSVLWNMYGRGRPDEEVPTVFASDLGLLHAEVDQPLEKFESHRSRYNWGDYIALSYVWGTPDSPKTILLNGVPHQVGPNLYDALSRLRESSEIKIQGLKVWIDALCINQRSLQERANEVPKMGMIYSEALAVRAWLGHQSDKIDAHLHGLRAIMEKCGISKHEFPSSPKPEIAQQHMAFVLGRKFLLHMCGKEQTARKMFSVLAGIFCKACWCRLWIIQELALAPSVVFWYGTNGVLLTVELAILTSKLLWSFGGPLSKLLYQSNNGYGAEAVAAIENGLKQVRYRINELRWHESYRCGCKEKPLWQLIDESRAAEAKDPRDKVYGLFALLPHNIRERVTPNYHPNFTVTDCYITFAKTCFEVQGNLNLLARLSGTPLGTLKEDWATWAFDLDAPESKPKIPSNTSLNNVLTEPMGLMCPNVLGKTEPGSASDLGLESEFEISVDERLLFCRAVFVDRVGSVAEWNIGTVTNSHLPERNGPKTTAEKGKQDPRLALARVLTNSATYYFTDYPSLLDVPWATLVKQAEGLDEEESEWYKNWRETTRRMEISIGVGEMDPQDFEFGHDTPVPWDECFRSLFSKQTVGSLLQPVRSFKLHGVPLESYFYSHEEYCYDLMSFRKTVHTAAVVLWYRRLCETETGMFGSVPVGTRPGDRIAVICGCDMPVVLRPHGNYYMVIGGCFIEGMMTGEAVEGVKKGQFTVESISLC